MVIIVALTVLLALRYMLLTRRSLCHPRSAFGRGLMVATGLFAALHFINIGTHVSLSCGIPLLKEHCSCCLTAWELLLTELHHFGIGVPDIKACAAPYSSLI